jgi:glyoxylase-like metal-dependent hydrolase (beta-lactamase superfamily II)
MIIDKLDLNLIRLNLDIINTWFYSDKDICFLVDPGPAVTINLLIQHLNQLKIKKIDLILLTHPHIDHAGGTGKILELFPQAKVVCHPNGIEHLKNPKRLWEASLRVLGKAAEFYGKIEPIPENRIQHLDKIETEGISIIETLGHSPHHQSYLYKDLLFIGEACGHHFPSEETIYIRPATPPKFDYDIYVSSLQKLLKLNLDKHKICFPHWGMRDNAILMIEIALEQIKTWFQVIESLFDRRTLHDFMELIFIELKKADRIFANLDLLTQEIKSREPFSFRQSAFGIIDFLNRKMKK